jgi:hypothetical protein
MKNKRTTMRNLAKRLAPVAAILLVMSSAAYARGGDRGGNDRGGHHGDDFIWRDHENGCAVGNDPPPGANCTGRDNQQNR